MSSSVIWSNGLKMLEASREMPEGEDRVPPDVEVRMLGEAQAERFGPRQVFRMETDADGNEQKLVRVVAIERRFRVAGFDRVTMQRLVGDDRPVIAAPVQRNAAGMLKGWQHMLLTRECGASSGDAATQRSAEGFNSKYSRRNISCCGAEPRPLK
jgi:hypothetical protein